MDFISSHFISLQSLMGQGVWIWTLPCAQNGGAEASPFRKTGVQVEVQTTVVEPVDIRLSKFCNWFQVQNSNFNIQSPNFKTCKSIQTHRDHPNWQIAPPSWQIVRQLRNFQVAVKVWQQSMKSMCGESQEISSAHTSSYESTTGTRNLSSAKTSKHAAAIWSLGLLKNFMCNLWSFIHSADRSPVWSNVKSKIRMWDPSISDTFILSYLDQWGLEGTKLSIPGLRWRFLVPKTETWEGIGGASNNEPQQ